MHVAALFTGMSKLEFWYHCQTNQKLIYLFIKDTSHRFYVYTVSAQSECDCISLAFLGKIRSLCAELVMWIVGVHRLVFSCHFCGYHCKHCCTVYGTTRYYAVLCHVFRFWRQQVWSRMHKQRWGCHKNHFLQRKRSFAVEVDWHENSCHHFMIFVHAHVWSFHVWRDHAIERYTLVECWCS